MSLVSPIPAPLDLLVWLQLLCYLCAVIAGESSWKPFLAAFRMLWRAGRELVSHILVPSFVWDESWQWISGGLGEVACDTVGL